MPLPKTPFALHGGCTCGAIRYKISVPAHDLRPMNPTDPNRSARLPMVATDSCNTCRQATGAVLPIWMCVPAGMLLMKLEPAPSGPAGAAAAEDSDFGSTAKHTDSAETVDTDVMTVTVDPGPSEDAADNAEGGPGDATQPGSTDTGTDTTQPTPAPFRPASEHIYPSPSSRSPPSTLRLYPSTPTTTRTFCSQCGTSLTFSRKPMTAGYPEMFDVLLGTLDREDVEKEWTAPEAHFWLSCGIPWVGRMLLGGGLPRYRRSRLDEVEGVHVGMGMREGGGWRW